MDIEKRYSDSEGRIRMTSTFIKAFMAQKPCPAQLKAIYLEQSVKIETTKAQRKGLYFETKVLGSSADGSKTITLPLTTAGKKTADQHRIEQQVANFKSVIKEHEITIQRKQIKIDTVIDKNFALGTVLDIIGIVDEDNPCIIDLKLTANVNSEWGDFAWGTPELMDHTQAILSCYIFEQMYDAQPVWYYLLFDYKPESDYKIIRRTIKGLDYKELQQQLNTIIQQILEWEKADWPYVPTYNNCYTCPLKAFCTQQITRKPIVNI